MDIREISIIHHIGIVLVLIWIFSSFNCCHPVVYFISLIYLYQVHGRYAVRLQRKLRYEERKQANQRRLLSDLETVRWLNHAVEKIWPICMEQIASQKILLPLIPWFVKKYKPWTVKEAVVRHLYLGRNPPTFTEVRVLRQSSDDDHLVLELGINFLSACDMSAILAVKLRKRLGFGMRVKLNITGMHVEGKVLVGIKFLPKWPFIGRLRLCFVEPPYFQMTVKPIFSHGLDVTDIPGIAGWLDNLLAIAFEKTLVEPNMLVVDMEKFISAPKEGWFSMDEREPVAYAKLEVVEAADIKPKDLNGLADPYVKGQLGPYRFQTKTQKKTLCPKWQEMFKIPICTWESPNVLAVKVCDKDHFHDDTLGDCSINISDLRAGYRHDIWLPLQNIKMGRLHLAITVVGANEKGKDHLCGEGMPSVKDNINSVETAKGSFASTIATETTQIMADKLEPISIEGQQRSGIWVHHPVSDTPKTWELRRGMSRHLNTEIEREDNESTDSHSTASKSYHNDNSSNDESQEVDPMGGTLRDISSVFHRSPIKDDIDNTAGSVPSPGVDLKAGIEKDTRVKLLPEDNISASVAVEDSLSDKENSNARRSGPEKPSKGRMKRMAKRILRHAGKSAHGLKHDHPSKGSHKHMENLGSAEAETENFQPSDSSDEDTLPSSLNNSTVERTPT